jgi:hypothetical protein
MNDPTLPLLNLNDSQRAQIISYCHDIRFLLDFYQYYGFFGDLSLTSFCTTSRFNLPYDKFVSGPLSNSSFTKLLNVLETFNRLVIYVLINRIAEKLIPNAPAASFARDMVLSIQRNNAKSVVPLSKPNTPLVDPVDSSNLLLIDAPSAVPAAVSATNAKDSTPSLPTPVPENDK